MFLIVFDSLHLSTQLFSVLMLMAVILELGTAVAFKRTIRHVTVFCLVCLTAASAMMAVDLAWQIWSAMS